MKRLTTLVFAFSFIFCTVSANAETENTSTPKVLNHLTMNQWVQVTENGSLAGRVFLPQGGGQTDPLSDVAVAILARDGKILRAKTNEDGEFQIADVQPGVYALTARGKNVFACCAMHVVDSKQAAKLDFPKQADIAMAGVDYTVVNTAVIRYLPPTVGKQEVNFGDLDLTELKDRVCGESLFRVAQSGDGMKGKLHVAGANPTKLASAGTTNVFLFSEGREIDRTISSPRGEFDFDDMDPGFYSILAIGPSGIGLIGFELVDANELEPSETANVAKDGTQLVRLFGHHGCCDCCQTFEMQIAPMPEVCSVVEEIIIEQPIVQEEMIIDDGCNVCGGEIIEGEIVGGEVIMDGFGTPVVGGGYAPGYSGGYSSFGGGGGGGGFGGGGGGLGGILALGTLGAVLATVDDDDDAFVAPIIPPPPVVSPAVPN